jgi:hypothetical protein
MALLSEFAITPDVFDERAYASAQVADLHLLQLKHALLEDGLVRDLRNGAWARLVAGDTRRWSRKARELVTKLRQQCRLPRCPPALSSEPTSDSAWCAEAIASQGHAPLDGIIVGDGQQADFRDEPLVASISRLTSASWWQRRGCSLRVQRRTSDYLDACRLVLRHSSWVAFVDPYIDPGAPNYGSFSDLIDRVGIDNPSCRIELHGCYVKGEASGGLAWLVTREASFREGLTTLVRRHRLTVEVFLWDAFHDRYLLSNLVGLSIPSGFDTCERPGEQTTWTRLTREDRDDVQREFDAQNRRHKLHKRFTI